MIRVRQEAISFVMVQYAFLTQYGENASQVNNQTYL